jgi:signal transduction histidine kinase
MQRAAVALVVSALAVALGLEAHAVARAHPGRWFGGSSQAAGALLLVVGWTLAATGLAYSLRRRESPVGPLLVAAGLAWFVPELDNPDVGSAVAFTFGLALAFLTPALVGHAVLVYPRTRLGSTLERAVVASAYGGAVLLLGLAPALLTDPGTTGCNACPANLLALADRPARADDLTRIGLGLGVVWAAALALLCVRRLLATRGHLARPVHAAGAVYLSIVAVALAVSVDRGFVETGTLDRRLWLGQAAALLALSGAIAWSLVRARRARAATAGLVVELAQSPPAGGLRDLLARIADDPRLELAYPLPETGRHVDARGRPVELPADLQQTNVVREGRTVAVLAHAPGLLDDEQVLDEVTSAARLALDNERLQAEVRARVAELRASRARIVAAGDAERRRLERDLHDGAQQRLVGLSLSLRMLRGREAAAPELAAADEELRAAIAELRELAHGIYPAVLDDEGLAAAVEALAEETSIPLRIASLAEGRFGAPVETAAYAVVTEVVRGARATVVVRTVRTDGRLDVELETAAADRIDAVGLEDRVGALDGRLSVERAADGGVHVHAELPCAS